MNRHLQRGALLSMLGSVTCLAPVQSYAQVIEAGVNATPAVLILFDTSGSMEWLDAEDTYPRCLSSASEYSTYAVACTTDSDCADGLYCNAAAGVCEFYRSRYHEALEALTGTIQNYFPLCDNRDQDADRLDQLSTSPPQGIRHSIACSYQSGRTEEQMCYRLAAGTTTTLNGVAAPPGDFRQRTDGLLDLYGSLLNFGFMAFDSFRDPSTTTEGMYSYGHDGFSPSPGLNPGACGNDTNCWNLGARRPGTDVEGGSIAPIDPDDDTTVRRQAINDGVQLALLNVVPYWSTPIGSMLEDALTFYVGGDDGDYYSWYRQNDPANTDEGAFDYARGQEDLYGECRRRSVILITDGVPSFDECTRRGTANPGDPFPAGCEGYWYRSSRYYASALLAEGIETYVIGFNISAELESFDGLTPQQRLQAIADAGRAEANPVRYADSSRDLIFELGDILSQLAAASTGRTRPATYNVLSTTEQGQYTLNARFNIDRDSRYWSGDLLQSARVCDGDGDLVTRPNVISAGEVLDERSPDERVLLTASPGIHSCLLSKIGNPSASLFVSTSFTEPNPVFGLSTVELAQACSGGSTVGGGSVSAVATQLSACLDLLDGSEAPATSTFIEDTERVGSCMVNMDLSLADANEEQFGAGDDAQARFFLRWLRGETLTEIRDGAVENDGIDYAQVLDDYLPANVKRDPVTGRYLRDRLSSLADIFHSSPAVLGPPVVGPNSSPSYLQFAEDTAEPDGSPRPSVVYVGTNDGLMHAFDALTMEELWAFMPPSFGPRISEWIGPGHTFMLDGTPVVQDIVFDRRIDNTGTLDATWGSVLVSGYREGGRGYVALNVTDPVNPAFLWELDAQHDPMMGLTYSEPGLGVVRFNSSTCPDGSGLGCERGVAILTGGLPPNGSPADSAVGRVVYVVDLQTGRVIRRFSTMRSAAGNSEAFPAALGGSISVFNGADGSLVSRAYFGDQAGRLYRLDLASPNPADWHVDLFFDPRQHPDFDPDARYGQVVFRPTVSLGADRRAIVVYGMGNVDQLDDLGPDRNYVLSLTERPVFSAGVVNRFEGFVNWAAELEQYEKLTARPRIFNDRAYFATFLPSRDNLCDIGGARLYGLDYDGERQSVIVETDYGTEGPVGDVGGFPEEFFFLPDSSDVGADGDLATGGETVPFWDASNGNFIPPRTILYSLDLTQSTVCVPLDSDDDLFSQTSISSPTATGSPDQIQLVVNMSSFETDSTGTPAATAVTRSFDIPINEFSRAYTTSWTLLLE
jgi:hypothetical protein